MASRLSSRRPFFLGANLPWLRYGDFGANRWQPEGGLQDAAARTLLDESFARLADEGLDVVRIFLLCDGRAGIEFDESGIPVRLDHSVYRDLDVLLEHARQRGIGLVPVLFDFLWAAKPRIEGGVQLGGHSGVLRDSNQRTALLERVVGPIVGHARDHPSVMAWDVINEPEWATLGLGTWNPRHAVEQTDMHSFLADTVRVVRELSDHEVTIGSASARWLWFVADLELDFLSPHWYDRRRRDVVAGDAGVHVRARPTRAARRVPDTAARRHGCRTSPPRGSRAMSVRWAGRCCQPIGSRMRRPSSRTRAT